MGDRVLEEKTAKTSRVGTLIILILVLFCGALISMDLWDNISAYLR